MGFWSRLRALGRKERKGTELEVGRWMSAPPRRGTRELLAAYREQPILRAPVDKISDHVAGISWRAYRRVRRDSRAPVKDFGLRTAPMRERHERLRALADVGEIEEVPDHPVLALLSDPNDHLTGRSIMKIGQSHLDIVGDAFWAIERKGKYPVGYWPIPPTWVSRLPDYRLPKAERSYTVQVPNVGPKIVPASEMIHFRSPDLDDPLGRGTGLGHTIGDELDTDEYASRFVKSSFWNNMLPAAVVSIEGMNESNSAGAKAFKESLAREHQGPEKAGKILIANGKTTFARLDTSFKDMDLVNLRKYLSTFALMIYGVPPEVIGLASTGNYQASQTADEKLARHVIAPRMDFWRTELQMRLVPLFEDDSIILDFDSPVPADREHQLKVMAVMPEAFELNEWRCAAGHRPRAEFQGKFPKPLPGQGGGDPVQTQDPGKETGQDKPPAPDADVKPDDAEKSIEPLN